MSRAVLRIAATASLVALMVAGCRDGVAPELRGASVRIFLGNTAYDEQTIAVGSTITLTANVLDSGGDKVNDQVVAWSSDRPEVATVDGSGVVRGVTVGSANIIAKHEIGEDTARVNVAAPLAGAPSCGPADESDLGVGQTKVFSGAEAANLCLPGDRDYSLVVVNGGSSAAAVLNTRIQATGVRTSTGPPTPNLVPAPGGSRVAGDPFHERLRHDISARLEPRLRAGIEPGAFTTIRPQVSAGEVLSFNVESSSSDGCRAGSIDRRGARVRLVTDHAVIVEDTLNPAGGFTEADYRQFGEFFDEEAWPLVTSTFGEPTDIDRNGRVIILFTRAVNERRENSDLPAFRGLFVGGFFFNRDLFPTTGKNECAGSNAGEMFYMLVPDPEGVVEGKDALGSYPGRSFRTADVKKTTPTVLVHEFQHLVNDSRRLHVTRSPVWEETWLNEGLSHIAEELMFYDQSGLRPRTNIDGNALRTNGTAREAFGTFHLHNLDRLAAMLREPDRTSLMGADLLQTRGAAWYFLRYAADRRGGDEGSLWAALVRDSKSAGLDNLALALGVDPREWIVDWAGAMYLDDTQLQPAAKHQTLSWNLRTIYPILSQLWPSTYYAQYPLFVRQLPIADSAQPVSLQGGSALYLRAGVAAGGRGAIRVAVGDLPAPSRLKVLVTRVR